MVEPSVAGQRSKSINSSRACATMRPSAAELERSNCFPFRAARGRATRVLQVCPASVSSLPVSTRSANEVPQIDSEAEATEDRLDDHHHADRHRGGGQFLHCQATNTTDNGARPCCPPAHATGFGSN